MPVYGILNTCFRELIGELEGRELLYTEIAQSIFRTLIMYVFRLVDTTHDIAPYIEMNRIIDSVTAFIERNFRKNLTLDSVAEACFTNKYYLSHLFSQVRKMTVWDYILERRVEDGKRLLAETGMTVAEVAEKSGFRDPGYFGRVFRKATVALVLFKSQNCVLCHKLLSSFLSLPFPGFSTRKIPPQIALIGLEWNRYK